MKYFFCGIGGIGMSAVALALKSLGHQVVGSDRSFDNNENQKMKERIEKKGIIIYPQDGSGIDKKIDFLVVSSAVEEHIPDIQKALSLKIKIKKRAQILAEFINKNLNRQVEVLVEKRRDKHTGNLKGMTRNYLTIQIVSDREDLFNSLQYIKITKYENGILFGELVD